MLHCRDGARFLPDVTLGILGFIGFIRVENLLSHGLRVLYMPFGKLQAGCHVPFTEELLPSGHSTIKVDWWSAAEMVVLLEVSSISTKELWSSVGSWPPP